MLNATLTLASLLFVTASGGVPAHSAFEGAGQGVDAPRKVWAMVDPSVPCGMAEIGVRIAYENSPEYDPAFDYLTDPPDVLACADAGTDTPPPDYTYLEIEYSVANGYSLPSTQ